MTTITLDIPNNDTVKYKKILTSFICDYNLSELKQIKKDYNFSIMMYKTYLESGDLKEDGVLIDTNNKSDKEISEKLNKNLWN